jgi:hypothetical protein
MGLSFERTARRPRGEFHVGPGFVPHHPPFVDRPLDTRAKLLGHAASPLCPPSLFHISSPPGLAGPAAHETSAILRPRRRHRGRYSLGANKPAYQLDPGFLEHLRLSPRAVIGPGARLLEFLFTGAPRRRRNPGGRHGTVASTLAVSTFTKRRWWPACAL